MKSLKENRFFKQIKEKYFVDKNGLLDVEGIDYFGNKIFGIALMVLVSTATPIFVIMLIKSFLERNYVGASIALVFLMTYFLLIGIKEISQTAKRIMMILSTYGFGMFFVFYVNVEASGLLVILATMVFTSFILDEKISRRLIFLNISVCIVLTICFFSGFIEDPFKGFSKWTWTLNSIILYAYGIGLFLLLQVMFKGLKKQALQIKEANKKALNSQKRYQEMIANIVDVIVIVDGVGVVKYISSNVGQIYGWESKAFYNQPLIKKIYPEDQSQAIKIFKKVQKEESSRETTELRHQCKNGTIKIIEATLINLLNDPVISGVLINYHDITERRTYEKKIIHMSHHDPLTGLYNRTYFNEIKDKIDCQENLPLTLISADVDGLKMINDSFGHLEGDRILKLCADLFKNAFRQEDIIARIGGDEFCILLPKTSGENADVLIDRIKNRCDYYNFQNENEVHYLSISMGLATKTFKNESFDKILQQADYQMYKEKNIRKINLSDQVFASMKRGLFHKWPELEKEGERLAILSQKMGKAMGLSQADLKKLELLATLSDIGKIGSDQTMLKENGETNDKDHQDLDRQAEIGYCIAKATPKINGIADSILAKDEAWDGSGYPKGLAGVAIPLFSRILAVAKFYDHLERQKDGQKRRTADKIGELKKAGGSILDPELVDVLISQLF